MQKFFRLKGPERSSGQLGWRLVAVAFAVFAVCMAVSTGLFFATRHSEDEDASRRFLDGADDLAVKVVTEFGDHARDLRILAMRVSQVIEGRGALPDPPLFARLCEGLRSNPRRFFTSMLLLVNVSDAQRPRFEAMLTAETGMRKVIYNPVQGASTPMARYPWYSASLFTGNDSEAYTSFTKALRGAAATDQDEAFRQSRAGRVISSAPTLHTAALLANNVLILLQASLMVLPTLYERWVPGAAAVAASTGAVVPLPYCSGYVTCPADVDRSANSSDPRVSALTSMIGLDVPMCGLLPSKLGSLPDVMPLCLPLPRPLAQAMQAAAPAAPRCRSNSCRRRRR